MIGFSLFIDQHFTKLIDQLLKNFAKDRKKACHAGDQNYRRIIFLAVFDFIWVDQNVNLHYLSSSRTGFSFLS
jgi:hypothetical protein